MAPYMIPNGNISEQTCSPPPYVIPWHPKHYESILIMYVHVNLISVLCVNATWSVNNVKKARGQVGMFGAEDTTIVTRLVELRDKVGWSGVCADNVDSQFDIRFVE